jgi:DNA-directed RNA polymerase subunit alpha
MEKFLKYTIKPEIEANNAQVAKFTISPLEKGFGVTLGNALRRTMLSNIPGSSIFAIKIPGVNHEFQAINGVKEDVTQIILNLKNLVITIDENVISDDELASTKIEQ